MAKSFTKDEVLSLISFHTELINDLSGIVQQWTDCKKEIVKISKDIVSSQAFDNSVMQFISAQVVDDRSPLAVQLIRAIYHYGYLLSVSSNADQMLRINSDDIKRNIDVVKRSKNGLRWFFTSSKKKEEITHAYEQLKSRSEGRYVTDAKGLIENADKIRSKTDDEIWSDFLSQKKWYQSLFIQNLGSYYSAPEVPQFKSIRSEFENVTRLIDQVAAYGKSFEQDIENAAMRLVGNESMSVLNDISIDEVNRESSGIRVKALKDAGIFTIADLYAASSYQLRSIHGISDNRAFELKRIAEKIAKDSYTGAKIRLSSDNRTEEATKVVVFIYLLRSYNAKVKELHEYTGKIQVEVKRAIEVFSKLGSSINWLFYDDEDRQNIAESYKYLEYLISENYINNVKYLISEINLSDISVDNDKAWDDFEHNSIQYYNILEKLLPGMLGNQDNLYGLPEQLAQDIQDQAFFPDGLLCTLRNYQTWGVKYILHQEKALLGDEMGLGKTVQAIAAMVSLRNTKETHFVVICPASVLANWCREIRKHSKLRVLKVHGYDRSSALRYWKKSGGVAVTTYETTAHFKLDDDFRFGMAVVDEAHYIKNPEARRSVNVKALCSHTDRLLFMTGTALENKVDEMINLIDLLRPEIAENVRPIAYMSTAPQFREKIAPVYYRRKREDVLTELPELIEAEEWCSMSAEEINLYEHDVRSRSFNAMRRVSWNVDNLEKSCKAKRMKELIDEAGSDGRKVLVFSFFRENINKICDMLGTQCYGPITGSVSPAQRQNIIDDFDKAPAGSVLVSQIQAGGTGLNIQSASVVILCEPQVKPSIENQAISRAYRMGQARNVLVYKLLCEESVDERMLKLLKEKQEQFDAFADESVAARESIELDEASFKEIINAEIERINAKKEQK